MLIQLAAATAANGTNLPTTAGDFYKTIETMLEFYHFVRSYYKNEISTSTFAT